MNPLTNIKNVQKLNDRELELGIIGKKSWHDEYKDSAWIFIGGLPFDLTEGDVICVFSQYGEIVNINLVRDHKTGKSKGFAFLCYEDQRSTVLSVDNLNGIKVLGRTIRVDHVKDYKMPKEHGDEDELTKKIREEGCAPKLESSADEEDGQGKDMETEARATDKKAKKKKKKKDKKKKENPPSNDETSRNQTEHQNGDIKLEVKKEKFDPGYDRALRPSRIKDEDESGPAYRPGHSSNSDHSHSPRHRDNGRRDLVSKQHRHDTDSDSDDVSGRDAFRYSGERDAHNHAGDTWKRGREKQEDREKKYSGDLRRERSRDREINNREERRDRNSSQNNSRFRGDNRRDRSQERKRERSADRNRKEGKDRDRVRDTYRDNDRRKDRYYDSQSDRRRDWHR